MPALPPYKDLDRAPMFEDLTETLDKLRRGKACGKTGVLPALLLYGSAALQDRLLLLLEEVWNARLVVQDLKDAVIVPIPKKGDLRRCDGEAMWRESSAPLALAQQTLMDKNSCVTTEHKKSICDFDQW